MICDSPAQFRDLTVCSNCAIKLKYKGAEFAGEVSNKAWACPFCHKFHSDFTWTKHMRVPLDDSCYQQYLGRYRQAERKTNEMVKSARTKIGLKLKKDIKTTENIKGLIRE